MEKKGLKGPRRGLERGTLLERYYEEKVREGQRDAARNEEDEFYYLREKKNSFATDISRKRLNWIRGEIRGARNRTVRSWESWSAGNGGPRTIVRSFLSVRGKISAQCHGRLFSDRLFTVYRKSVAWQIIRLYERPSLVKFCSPCKNSCKKFYVAHDYNVGREECEQEVARLIDEKIIDVQWSITLVEFVYRVFLEYRIIRRRFANFKYISILPFQCFENIFSGIGLKAIRNWTTM